MLDVTETRVYHDIYRLSVHIKYIKSSKSRDKAPKFYIFFKNKNYIFMAGN